MHWSIHVNPRTYACNGHRPKNSRQYGRTGVLGKEDRAADVLGCSQAEDVFTQCCRRLHTQPS